MIPECCDRCGADAYLCPVWDIKDNPAHLCKKCIIADEHIIYDEYNCFYFIEGQYDN
jgi:hypothetical protein